MSSPLSEAVSVHRRGEWDRAVPISRPILVPIPHPADAQHLLSADAPLAAGLSLAVARSKTSRSAGVPPAEGLRPCGRDARAPVRVSGISTEQLAVQPFRHSCVARRKRHETMRRPSFALRARPPRRNRCRHSEEGRTESGNRPCTPGNAREGSSLAGWGWNLEAFTPPLSLEVRSCYAICGSTSC
jgi:hypothetical protein